jgi:hypothetical protein
MFSLLKTWQAVGRQLNCIKWKAVAEKKIKLKNNVQSDSLWRNWINNCISHNNVGLVI